MRASWRNRRRCLTGADLYCIYAVEHYYLSLATLQFRDGYLKAQRPCSHLAALLTSSTYQNTADTPIFQLYQLVAFRQQNAQRLPAMMAD